ncbi:terpene cyclase [Pleurotus pulmonarius]|nr:terpene cyclase [Pleurotus pulmonarius]KAF4601371.1 terpene cyclase [Pleurotus pulmonarius]KAF4601744.1 terpene cyclase [Pleurotus pulmonarius]
MSSTPLRPDLITFADEDVTYTDVYLPRTLDSWPWPRRTNPHYGSVKKQASAWCESFQAFSPQAQVAFNKCDFNLLASLAYPGLDERGYRVACDLMNLFFCIDEHTDVATAEVARAQVRIIMDALRNPFEPRPSGEWVIGEMARQYWANAILIASPAAQTRFVSSFQIYLDAVIQQAEDRVTGSVRTVEDYFRIRRKTIGVEPSLAIGELYMNIPQEVIDDPVIAKLKEITIDLIHVANDIYSYKVEWERGDEGHNLVTVVIQQFRMNIQDAINYIGNLHERLVDQFLEQWKCIPVFGGPVDAEVRAYCDMLGEWVRGNDSWSFESERYFGRKGTEVQANRVVRLTRIRGEKCVG